MSVALDSILFFHAPIGSISSTESHGEHFTDLSVFLPSAEYQRTAGDGVALKRKLVITLAILNVYYFFVECSI
jgi:hypothetical protein